MCGRVLSQWWDGTEAAGPRSRPTVPFGEAPPDLEVLALQQNEPKIPSALVQKYQGSHEEKLTSLQDSLKEETGIIEALKAYNDGGGSTRGSSASAPATAQVDRTLASPDWQGEPPHNFRKRLELQPVPLADFKSNHTSQAACVLAREPKVELVLTTAGKIWLCNGSDTDIDLPHGDLFGFRQAQNSAEAVPFVVTDDRGLLVQVDASGKEVRSLAEIVCWVTKTRGVCDVKLKNHTLTQKLQVDATGAQIPVAYRYGLALDETVSAFQPKELEEGIDRQSIRATQFGAVFKTRYNQLPTSAHSKILWEESMINAVLAAAATDAPDDRDEDLDGLGDDEGDEEEADEDDFDEVEELAQGPTQDD
eukprot:symbB.v1.2.024555.t1/scaffold2333.1/size82048/2